VLSAGPQPLQYTVHAWRCARLIQVLCTRLANSPCGLKPRFLSRTKSRCLGRLVMTMSSDSHRSADLPVIFVHGNGMRSRGRLAVEFPQMVSNEEATCVVILDGLRDTHFVIRGSSSLQALVLSLQFMAEQLRAFYGHGGKLVATTDGSDLSVDAIFRGLWG
jgi:hypothetical protein